MSRLVQPLAVAFLLGAAVMLFVWKPWEQSQAAFDPDKPAKKDAFGETRGGGAAAAKEVAFDGDRAMKYLKQLCDLGPRVSGTDGMAKQQELLVKHFEAFGGTVTKQEFEAKQESRRDKVKMTNLTVSWFPDRDRRVMLCAHYDTRPIAHEDNPRDWRQPFASANDGTSGVAMLMELAHTMKDVPTAVGVDFVLFDGEEYIFEPTGLGGLQRDRFFIGSDHFASQYAAAKGKRKHTYEAAVLFDLFAHPGAKFAVEGYSWAKAEPLARQFWQAAADAKAGSFLLAVGGDVQDDHLALNRVGIPAIDVIDFDGYRPHWHKLSDTPDKCDGKQMAEVAKVTATWLQGRK